MLHTFLSALLHALRILRSFCARRMSIQGIRVWIRARKCCGGRVHAPGHCCGFFPHLGFGIRLQVCGLCRRQFLGSHHVPHTLYGRCGCLVCRRIQSLPLVGSQVLGAFLGSCSVRRVCRAALVLGTRFLGTLLHCFGVRRSGLGDSLGVRRSGPGDTLGKRRTAIWGRRNGKSHKGVSTNEISLSFRTSWKCE